MLRVSSDYLRTCKAECPGKPGNTCDSPQSKRHQIDGCRHGPFFNDVLQAGLSQHRSSSHLHACICEADYSASITTPSCRHQVVAGSISAHCQGCICMVSHVILHVLGRAQPSLLVLDGQNLCMQVTSQPVHNLVHALKRYTCNTCAHTTLVLQICQQLFMAHHCIVACLLLKSLLLNIAIALTAGAAAYHYLVCIAMLLCTALTGSCCLWLTRTAAVLTRICCSLRCDCTLLGHTAMREEPWKDAAWHDSKRLVVPHSKVQNAVSRLQQQFNRSVLGCHVLNGQHAFVTTPIWYCRLYNVLHSRQSICSLKESSRL